MSTPRLPPQPKLSWKSDGTPVATGYDDVYFSAEDGLAETRAVFLQGCGLPERWQGRTSFTVAELGFGTGLNLLALWHLWRAHRPSRNTRLDFVSFEGFPLDPVEASRALSRWPELAPLSKILVANWPVRARGVQQISLPDNIVLTLHIDDIAKALPESQFKADAWFLDGFAPAKNQDMWDPALFPLLRDRSAPGALIGTYTVAGAVRRGLAEAGFEVSKQPGFGRKRDRLQAIAPASADTGQSAALPRSVAIIGAGIAGASAAQAFAQYGADITVFDTADKIAAGASGNRLALLMPRLDAADTGPARALLASYLAARRLYTGLAGAHPVTVEQRPRNAQDEARFAKLMADPPLPPGLLSADTKGRLQHHGALILEPAKLLPALLAGARLCLGRTPVIDLPARTVDGQAYDLIILANGLGMKTWSQTGWLPLEPRLGQVNMGTSDTHLTQAIASGHYALALGQTRLWGATFTAVDQHEPHTIAPVSHTASTENAAALTRLVSKGWLTALPDATPDTRPNARAGLRATTPDKLPLAGPAPDFDACLQQFAPLRQGLSPSLTPETHKGILLLGGLGARGFTFAPWLAAFLAAQAYHAPAPLSQKSQSLTSPMRFIYRGLKRGQL